MCHLWQAVSDSTQTPCGQKGPGPSLHWESTGCVSCFCSSGTERTGRAWGQVTKTELEMHLFFISDHWEVLTLVLTPEGRGQVVKREGSVREKHEELLVPREPEASSKMTWVGKNVFFFLYLITYLVFIWFSYCLKYNLLSCLLNVCQCSAIWIKRFDFD